MPQYDFSFKLKAVNIIYCGVYSREAFIFKWWQLQRFNDLFEEIRYRLVLSAPPNFRPGVDVVCNVLLTLIKQIVLEASNMTY